MKILIISLPRTGSSNLLFKLAEENKLKPIYEPFHDGTNQFKNWIYRPEENNVIIKTIINHHHNNLQLVKDFNKIILLSRRDLKSCTESWIYFIKNVNSSFTSHQSYYYENIYDKEFDYYYKIIKEYHYEIENLSKILNVPITYYEDIFDIKSSERLRKYNRKDIKKNKMI
jgi:Mg2+ and Co2+ transporter CorA